MGPEGVDESCEHNWDMDDRDEISTGISMVTD